MPPTLITSPLSEQTVGTACALLSLKDLVSFLRVGHYSRRVTYHEGTQVEIALSIDKQSIRL